MICHVRRNALISRPFYFEKTLSVGCCNLVHVLLTHGELDRLTQHRHILETGNESYRLKAKSEPKMLDAARCVNGGFGPDDAVPVADAMARPEKPR